MIWENNDCFKRNHRRCRFYCAMSVFLLWDNIFLLNAFLLLRRCLHVKSRHPHYLQKRGFLTSSTAWVAKARRKLQLANKARASAFFHVKLVLYANCERCEGLEREKLLVHYLRVLLNEISEWMAGDYPLTWLEDVLMCSRNEKLWRSARLQKQVDLMFQSCMNSTSLIFEEVRSFIFNWNSNKKISKLSSNKQHFYQVLQIAQLTHQSFSFI